MADSRLFQPELGCREAMGNPGRGFEGELTEEESQMMKRLFLLIILLLIAGCSRQHRLSQTEVFDLRTKCQVLVDALDQDDLDAATPMSHYNPVTNRCYAEEHIYKDGKHVRMLVDAQTRKPLIAADETTKSGLEFTTDPTRSHELSYSKANAKIDLLMSQEQ